LTKQLLIFKKCPNLRIFDISTQTFLLLEARSKQSHQRCQQKSPINAQVVFCKQFMLQKTLRRKEKNDKSFICPFQYKKSWLFPSLEKLEQFKLDESDNVQAVK
jgi:hypothetical protein